MGVVNMCNSAEDVSTVSNVSVCSDEDLDVSQRFIEAFFMGPSLKSDAEEMEMNTGVATITSGGSDHFHYINY